MHSSVILENFKWGDCCNTLDRNPKADHCKEDCTKPVSLIVFKQWKEEIANYSTIEGQ